MLYELRKWKEAEEMWEGVVRRRKEGGGTGGVGVLEPLLELGCCLKKQKKKEELKEKKEECIEVARECYGEGSKMEEVIRRRLADCGREEEGG